VVREARRTRAERRRRRNRGTGGTENDPRGGRGAVVGRVSPGDRSMSAPSKSGGGSRLSNGSYPAQRGRDADAADQSHRPDVPTPEERVSGIVERYGDRVFEPLSETHGRKLREECLAEPETVERMVETGENAERVVSETVAQGAIPLIGAIAEMLEWYEGYRDRSLRLGRGSEVRGDHESFLVDMDNSLTPEYQSKQYARLNAFKRQFIGGEYPNGVVVEGEFSDPVSVLFGLTSSSLRPDGTHRPMVDHDREIREAWKGSSGSVKRTLRYVLEDCLGLEPGDYAWWWQSEPHPGPQKAATGYSHSHPVVVFDAAAVSDEAAATDPETYRPVVAKHVAECEGAGWEAHGLDDAVSVREADDIEDFASYVAEYLSVAPDDDLLERSDEYLMWAASQWATTTQKYSRSKWATAAVKADRCEQEAMDPEADQTARHGERVRRAAPGASHSFECAECGSPHGIDQSGDSLAARRLENAATPTETGATVTAATDGGEPAATDDGATQTPHDDESGRSLAERWPSARSAGAIQSEPRARDCGHRERDTCPLCATETEAPHHTVSGEVPIPETAEAPPGETETVGIDREPTWEPEAVVQTASGDETEIGSPGGTAYGEIVVEGAESITSRSPLSFLPDPSVLKGPEPWADTWKVVPDEPIGENTDATWAEHIRETRDPSEWRVRDGEVEELVRRSPEWLTEEMVRLGLVPPPELVAREMAEAVQGDRRVTPKRWSSTWYAERFGEGDDGPEEEELEPESEGVDEEAVRELVGREEIVSVPSVMGRLHIDPSRREVVEELVAECR